MKKAIRVQDLHALLTTLNEEAVANGEVFVPFTDIDYYTEQIANIYGVDEAEARKLAGALSYFIPEYTEDMNCLQEAIRRIENRDIDDIKPVVLYLAWLQFHIENAGLHPDDYLSPDGGYCGWQVLLAYEVWKTQAGGNDILMYPSCISVFDGWTADQLLSFHADDEDHTFREKIQNIRLALHDLHVSDLDSLVEALGALFSFHDGGPEDVVASVKELLDLFEWIKSKAETSHS